MHRNTFINSPKLLNADFSLRENENLFFAGQLTGVEGYMESAASGILAGINAVRRLNSQEPVILPTDTMLGALAGYISDKYVEKFQPMGANFGVLPDKQERGKAYSDRALKSLGAYLTHMNLEV